MWVTMHGSEIVKSSDICTCTHIHGVIPQNILFFCNSRWESVRSDKRDQNFVQENAKVLQSNFTSSQTLQLNSSFQIRMQENSLTQRIFTFLIHQSFNLPVQNTLEVLSSGNATEMLAS